MSQIQSPIFRILMTLDPRNLPEGIKQCRIFSRNDKEITGMTDSFQLDFNVLKREIHAIDLSKIDGFAVVDNTQQIKRPGDHIPINSHFYFNIPTQANGAISNYNFIDITVNTQCFNNRIFGRGKVASKTYTFPFREQFPIMAVTPKAIFAMDVTDYRDWRGKQEILKKQRL